MLKTKSSTNVWQNSWKTKQNEKGSKTAYRIDLTTLWSRELPKVYLITYTLLPLSRRIFSISESKLQMSLREKYFSVD